MKNNFNKCDNGNLNYLLNDGELQDIFFNES